MSATAWLIIAIVGFSLAGIALIVAVFMFIKMNIPSVIGDLTGKTVAREIKAMREFNNSKGDRRFRPSKVNLERGTLTEKVDTSIDDKKAMAEAHASKRLDRTETNENKKNSKSQKSNGTIGLNDFEMNPTDVLNEGSTPTEVLSDNSTEVLAPNATEVLSENQTEVLNTDNTEVLSKNTNEPIDNSTTVLSDGTTVLESIETLENNKSVAFKITKDHVITHTDEVI